MIQRKACLVAILFFPFLTFAQEGKSRISPLAVATARYKDAYLKITYSQPHKNGRETFGTLVPYGEIWKTGDNEATEMTITRDILINEVALKAGTYSIFTIPNRETWTIILNSDLGLWGSYNYNIKTDVLRFDRPVESVANEVYEAFTIVIEPKP
jgi:hypothetical protein